MNSIRPAFIRNKIVIKIGLPVLLVVILFFVPGFLVQEFAAGKLHKNKEMGMHAQDNKALMSGAASFLNSLEKSQLEKAQYKFDDSSKARWHYLPAASFSRAGISIGELNDSQEELLYSLLQDFLSQTGYRKAKQIISLEEVLVELGGSPRVRNPEAYYAAFYGNPEKDSLWAWSFEGHHISLNFTVLGNKVSMTPRFFGANPATVPRGARKGLRTLDKEEDLALKLIGSMSESQKTKTVFSENTFYDITTSNEPEVNPLVPVGIRMKDLNDSQQQLLISLIDEYLAAMPPELAAKRMENLKKEEYGEIRFGWAGGTRAGEAHYYRIQGKTFLVEFDNTQNNANHIHTVWRDFDGDFGRDLIRDHYRTSTHHHPHE